MSSITESRDGQQGRMSKQLNRLTICIGLDINNKSRPMPADQILKPRS